MSRPLHMPCCVCSTGEMINFQQLWLYVPLPYSISILDNIFNVCAPSCGTVECLKIVSVEGLFTISQFFIKFFFPFHGSSQIFGVAEAASESMLLVEVIFYSYSYKNNQCCHCCCCWCCCCWSCCWCTCTYYRYSWYL